MDNSLFLFGNGLGMSIDSDFFSLTNAMKSAWQNNDLSCDHKTIISKCLSGDNHGSITEPTAPTREEHLNKIHKVLFACELLRELNDMKLDAIELPLLRDSAKSFPEALKGYIHLVASHFMGFDETKLSCQFSRFVCGLSDYIANEDNITTVATLNYDDLLYNQFNKNKVFNNFYLRDEFIRGSFDLAKTNENIDASTPQSSWYLHLHGSPLFDDIDDSLGGIIKHKRHQSPKKGLASNHLVLTHHEHKPRVIEQSRLLKEYFDIFQKKLVTSTNVVLFGYSGNDNHVNKAIKNYIKSDDTIRIVEWKNPEFDLAQSRKYWSRKLELNIGETNIIRLENIQEFNAWAKP